MLSSDSLTSSGGAWTSSSIVAGHVVFIGENVSTMTTWARIAPPTASRGYYLLQDIRLSKVMGAAFERFRCCYFRRTLPQVESVCCFGAYRTPGTFRALKGGKRA